MEKEKKSTKIYTGKKITISTEEEQEINSYQHWLSLSPEQRFMEATQLIRQIYSRELLEIKTNSRIHFRSIE